MYKDFYGFSEEPFALAPDLGFLFLTDSHRKILDSLLHAIRERKGFSLVTGGAGTGKTILIRHLISMLDSGIRSVFIDYPPETFEELLEQIFQDLGVPPEERSKSAMLAQLNEYLRETSSRGEALLICVDEAQELNEGVMEELRLLGNPDPRMPGPGVVQELLIGDPTIEEKLKSTNLRQLLQRISITCRLEPLSESESRQYIQHRLNRVGSNISDVLTPDAADLICRYGRGVPGVINMLCSIALSAGYALSRKKVDADLVEGVSLMLARQKPGGRQRMESSFKGIMHHLASSPLIMKMTYVLWAYSLLALVGLFCLQIFF